MAARLDESQLLEFAKSIELSATKVLEGMHKSRRGGEGLEFHSARPYTDGEDTRFIDWKRFAATDRYYVKNYERTEKTSWTIVIDRSKSMTYRSKKKVAEAFASSIAFISQALGDSWTLWPHGPMNLSSALEKIFEGDYGADLPELSEISPRFGDRLLIISDFMFDPEGLSTFFQDIQAENHWMHLIQILSPEEQKFDFSDVIDFRDLEGREKLVLDSKATRSSYLRALEQLRNEWKKLLPEKATWLELSADERLLEKNLLEFFESL